MSAHPTSPTHDGPSHPDWMFCCWAKLGDDDGSPGYHPLLCHMIDVAMVALETWRSVLSSRQRKEMARSLGFGEDQDAAGRWCAFLAGLHDLGKASPAFQFQVDRIRAAVRERLQGIGLPTGPRYGPNRTPHGIITAATLPDTLETDFGLDRLLARRIGVVVGGHHGIFPTSSEIQKVGAVAKGRTEWDAHRRALVNELAAALGVPRSLSPRRIDNAMAMILAGFVSVSDWVGSNVAHFPYSMPSSVSAYVSDAGTRAQDALSTLGWLSKPHPQDVRGFNDLFPRIGEPNDLQRSAESLAAEMAGPGMVLVEAPMGEGKTETAVYLADRWAASSGQDGHYFALPTQATSNQMFGRIREYLQDRYEGTQVQLQLLHGHASLSSEFEALRQINNLVFAPGYRGVDDDSDELTVVASEWFTHRKRGLLAPFGVGTIDQALLAALQTKHVFVRLFGLAYKTVIVDEVHAYDAYMTTLLERLLEWLAALGSSVVLLSATLPKARREQLLAAYARGLGKEPEGTAPRAEYPRVSWVSQDAKNGSRTVAVSARGRKEFSLTWSDGSLPGDGQTSFPLGDMLEVALARGGCAAVICNTVRRAQETYLALKAYFRGVADDGESELDLLHSQYPFEDRELREQRALARFGKLDARGIRRPHRAVLVATQVIEQSLDLDFDLMVSDMAPADLLLQRAGRLHRHERSRPPGLEKANLLVCGPDIVDEAPRFDRGTGAVYNAHILLRSWLALRHRDAVLVPDDVETIIEAVYGDDRMPDGLPGALSDAWESTREELEAAMGRYREEAQVRWIGSPSFSGQLWRITGNTLDEDTPEFHQAHRALTRLASPTVPAVLLFGNEGTAYYDAACREMVDLGQPPSVEVTKRLLLRSVNISDRRVVFQLLEQSPPANWLRSPFLRHHRAVFLDGEGASTIGSYRLNLAAETGVVITRRQ